MSGRYQSCDCVIERVELQQRAKARGPGELGAHEFQRWLEQWRARDDVRVFVARDGTHALAVLR